MEVLILIGVGIVVLLLFIISQNRTRISDRTTVTTRKTIHTEDGEVRVERTQVLDTLSTQYHKAEPMPGPSIAKPPQYDQSVIENYKRNNSLPNKTPQTMPHAQLATITNSHPEELPEKRPVASPAPTAPLQEMDSIETDKKRCKRCNRNLNLERFGVSPKSADGRTVWCRQCLDAPRDTAKKKYCPKCTRQRLRTSFYSNANRKDGLTLWCKDCMDKSKGRR
ncbi:hypothetical protein IMA99_001033 [Salmonella enterica]|nr:hypothetical protein [Salmonella enterica]EDR7170453.1 hypothetical protein [Salmonella enterica subsp. houtenae]EHB3807236.1 hypothetical protein [Salmonella enterica subsp. enterica serovar Bonariensis]EHQ1840955.1 hypothetical protein [Salmonella enterica subsp. enterica serovar Saintpaul]ECY2456170.1 hypothetical protein [Salmonella enterica]